jgi:hypothetical protein
MAKDYQIFGALNFHKYSEMLDEVTSSDINRVVSRALNSKPTMLVTGGAINLVPTITEVQRQLQ